MRGIWGRFVGLPKLFTGLLLVAGVALWQPMADSGAATTCKGRQILTCSERTALYYDAVEWAVGGIGSLDLFQAPLHLRNPALASFWRYEAATGIVRYEYDLAIGSPGQDLQFESPLQAASPPPPAMKPTGIVTGHMAWTMNRLVKAEQQEVVNLIAMDTALNRSSGAAAQSRPDWAKYLLYVAAGFGRRAAAAIGRMVPRQRAVTRALVHARLMFGTGPADQKAEQRYVRKHGFPRAISQIMLMMGTNPIVLSIARQSFVRAKPNPTTFSMSRYLSSASVIRNEQKLAAAFGDFAARVPAAPHPPD